MSFYNPAIHNRRSIRLRGYDYSQSGLYFITVCCHERTPRFGEIVNGEMILNEMGSIAHEQWVKLAERFVNFELDVFQIMPDHIHVIISLTVGATLAVAPDNNLVVPDLLGQPQGLSLQPTIGSIMGAYKSIVSNECLKIYKSKNQCMGKLWQRNYYEHIIRSYESYVDISNYIIDNPKKWNRK
jgi:putative transposase